MDSIQTALDRLEHGHGSQEDVERLANFVRRAMQFTGAPSSTNSEVITRPNLYSLVHAFTEISSALDIEQIAQVTAARTSAFVHADSSAVFAASPGEEIMHLYGEVISPRWQSPHLWGPDLDLEEMPFIRSALRENRPLLIVTAPARASDPEQVFLRQTSSQKAVLVPVSSRSRALGVIVLLFTTADRRVSAHEMVILRLLANQAGVAIENAQLYSDARQRTQELEAVHQASLSLTASLDPQEVFTAILSSTLSLLQDVQDGHIFLYEDEKLTFALALNANGVERPQLWTPRSNGLTATVARTGEMIMVHDMKSHSLYHNTPNEWHGSIIGMPLKIEKRVVGVMNVARTRTGGFNSSEMRLLRLLADQAALAIENARLHKMISTQALTDSLTELPNRRYFDIRLADEINRSNRYRHDFTLVLLDLDHFKSVNDTFGHPVGDRVLAQLSALLRESIHDTDFLARYGGDEFALILPETGGKGARAMCERVRTVLAKNPFPVPDGNPRYLSASMGYAVYPVDAGSAADLVALADRQLYDNKHQND